MLIALEARKDEPGSRCVYMDRNRLLRIGWIWKMPINILTLTYNELRYTPFSMEDKKYWQFYKQRKEELNPKKKTKSKIRYFQTIFCTVLNRRYAYLDKSKKILKD